MDKFGRISAFLLGIAAIWLVSAGSVMAQENRVVAGSKAAVILQGPAATADGTDKAAAPIAGSVATVGGVGKTVAASPEGPPATAGGTDKATANDYKGSLNALSSLYQNEVQRLEKQNGQLKELYTQGIVARKEIEGSDKAVADARTKLEDIAKQIAAANQPAPPSAANVASIVAASNQAWTTGNGRVDGLIRFYGNQNGVDPYLVYCLMSQESKFKTIATSSKGAQGLMQLMPGTAARYGVTNPYDMAQSIMGGTRYLKDLLKMFNGRVDLALAGYNAGENAVIKHGYAVPPYDETRNYVRLIIARYGKKQAPGAPSL
jgi:soluble lytic murein transglycosylase-like protein